MSDNRYWKDKWEWDEYKEAQRLCRMETNRLIRIGTLCKPDACEGCEKPLPKALIHSHHEDYECPQEVEFLCAKCHGSKHRRRGVA